MTHKLFTDFCPKMVANAVDVLEEIIAETKAKARDYGCGTVQITASDMGVLLYTNYGFEKNGNFMQFKL